MGRPTKEVSERKLQKKLREEAFEKKLAEKIDRLYDLYPRKQGKKRGVSKLKTILTESPELFEEIRRAILRYALECHQDQRPIKFIKMFITFINNWEEYDDQNFEHTRVISRNKEVWLGDSGDTLY